VLQGAGKACACCAKRRTDPFRFQNPKGISSSSPGLRAMRYPGLVGKRFVQPGTGCGFGRFRGATPLELRCVWAQLTQGSACRATLGFGSEFRWDSRDREQRKVGAAFRICALCGNAGPTPATVAADAQLPPRTTRVVAFVGPCGSSARSGLYTARNTMKLI